MEEDLIKTLHRPAAPETDAYPRLSQTPRKEELEATHTVSGVDNTNRNFKGQQKNEIVYCFSRRHWIVLIPHFIGFAIFLLFTAAYFITAPLDSINAILGVEGYHLVALLIIGALTYYLHRFFIGIFNYYLQIFIITNLRVIELGKTLYLTSNRDSVELNEIQNIEVRQKGVLQSLFNYGEIIITLSSAHASKKIAFVPNPGYYFRKIGKTQQIGKQLM